MTDATRCPTAPSDLRRLAEEKAQAIQARLPETLSPEEAGKLIHELQVHQIELQLQNEELRRAQGELEASRARYFDLYDLAPVGYCTLSEQGLILEANLTAATLLGAARSMLVKQPLSRFILKEDQDIYYRHRRQLFETHSTGSGQAGEPQKCELRLVKPDGTLFWASLTGTGAQAEDGTTVCRMVISDITERKRAEEENGRFRTISDNAVYGKAIADLQCHLLYVNRFLAGIHGYRPEELIGKHVSLFHSGEQMEAAHRLIADMLRDGHFAPTTVWHRHQDGTDFPMLMSGVLLKDDYGNPQSIAVSAIDISAQHQAVAKIAESEKLLSRAQEIAHIGSWKLDLTANCLTWSDEVYRIFGCEPQEFAATYEAFLDFIHADDRAAVAEAYSRSLGSGSDGYEIEHRIVRRDSGEVRHVHERCVHERDDAGTIIQSTGMVQDITDRKRAEDALREREETYRALVDGLPDIVMRFDREGRFLFVSDNVREVIGIEAAQFIGTTLAELGFPEAQCQFWDKSIRQVFDSGAPFESEFTVEGQAGAATFNWRLVPERDAQGAVSSVLSISRDVTAHKQAEAEKEHLQARLIQAQKMESVGRLAGGVAHDFNNMLQAILGNTELALEQVSPDAPLHADLEEIQKAAGRSADLTRQLLAFARKQTVSPKVVDLTDTTKDMLKMLRRLIGEDIDLSWRPGKEVWPVKMDPSQIDQILANLCVNARDAIVGEGKITIETDRASFDEEYCARHAGFVPGDFALLTVSDDGCGMDAETLSQIFEPFFTTKEVGKGTGLGLATVYGAVQQNQGFVTVTSEPGQGTTFRIYLPRHAAKAAQETEERRPQAAARCSETILLVEDELAILRMTTMLLERLGYIVLAAGTSSEAVRLASEHSGRIDLLMTDVVMPDMNGRDLARNLILVYPGLKCLFMSGYTADVIAHHGVVDPGVHFIQKPFSSKELGAKLHEVLEG